jgi:Kdo2-lipid IVA lauroyltransferase/acyltransferase
VSKPNTLRYTVEAFAMRTAFAAFGMLPIEVSSGFFGYLARWFGPLLPVSRQAERRLARALPALDARQRRDVIRRMWENFGRVLGEYPHLSALQVSGPDARIEVIGGEHLDRLRDDNAAAFLVSAHYGNWEALLRVAQLRGLDLTFVRREANNPGTEKVLRTMGHWRGRSIAKGARGGREMLRALSNNERLFLLIDQKMNDGIAVPFFGRDAMTAPAVGRLALAYKCPVVMGRVERLQGARFRVTISPPLAFELSGEKEADTLIIMKRLNDAVEAWIRERPDQWLWLHNRWPD